MSRERPFSHLDARGAARMVDVSEKAVTRRIARASCRIALEPATLQRLESLPKGDALAVARIAGIQAAKRTSEWIPLAHPLVLDQVTLEFERQPDALTIVGEVTVTGRTGAEMEALVACSAAALAIYDMVKAVDRGAVITDLRLEAKRGGAGGTWTREE